MGKPGNRFRHWLQAAWFALTNGYAKGFLEGKIYTGGTKSVCVPGLNCYSCPGAVGSCPIGSLQAVLGSKGFVVSCYVFGLLMAFGALFGRLICGWMCPFGLVQDLLYKIPVFKKIKNLPGDRILKWLKYVILIVFVLLLPSIIVDVTGMGSPWFCEYICPSGTLLGGIPLVVMNEGLQQAVGFRFAWKLILLFAILLLSVKAYRPCCKYLCPLGAIYGLFNPISLYRFKVDQMTCIQCGACQKACKMDIKVWEKPNSMDCIRCGDCKAACPQHAITSTWEAAGKKCLIPTPQEKVPRKPKWFVILGVLVTAASAYLALEYYMMFDSCILGLVLSPSFATYVEIVAWGIALASSVLGVAAGVYMILFSKDAAQQKTMEHMWMMGMVLLLLAVFVFLFTGNWLYILIMVIYSLRSLVVLVIWKVGLKLAKKKSV